MKKLLFISAAFTCTIYIIYLLCLPETEYYFQAEHDNQSTLAFFSTDSINLKQQIGDSFALKSAQQTYCIDSNLLICEINKKERLAEYIYIDFAVFDLKKKKLLKLFRLPNRSVDKNDKILYPILYIENNILYVSCYQNSGLVATINLSTYNINWKKIEGCYFKSSVGAILKFGRNFYQLGKPYCAGIFDWETGKCSANYKNDLNLESDDNGYVANPIAKDINLFKIYTIDSMDFYRAYSAPGKMLWECAYPLSTCAATKNRFLIFSKKNLFCLNKYSGSIIQKVAIDGPEDGSIFNVENNNVWICYQVSTDLNRPNRGTGGPVHRNYLLKLVDLSTEKIMKSEYLETFDTQEFRIGEYYITQYAYGEPSRDTVVGQSYLIERVYSVTNMKKIEEHKYKYVKLINKGATIEDRYSINELNLLDKSTGKKYVLSSKGVLFW